MNDAPVLGNIGDKCVDEEQTLTFTVSASDLNDSPMNTVTLAGTGLPDEATFDPVTGIFSWKPSNDAQGTYAITFAATDDGFPNLSDSETITITVNEVNGPPMFVDKPADITIFGVGGSHTVDFNVVDPNEDPLTLSAAAFQTDIVAELAARFAVGKGLNEAWGGFGYNFRGHQEKYFADTNGTWYYLLPNGELHIWQGSFTDASLITTLSQDYWADPYRLFNATPPARTPMDASNVTFIWSGDRLVIDPADQYEGTFVVDVTVSDGTAATTSSFLVAVTNTAPCFGSEIADMDIARVDGSATVGLRVSDPDGDTLTVTATAYQANQVAEQAFLFADGKGLYEAWGGFGYNHRGHNEKYFADADGNWYYLLPNGELHDWQGDFTDASLIASLSRDYWTDPYLLFNATQPIHTQLNASEVALTVSEDQITIEPAADYLGSLFVAVSATDGWATTTNTFMVTVTNAGPVFDSLVPDVIMSRAEGVRTIDLNVTDPDGDIIIIAAVPYEMDIVAETAFEFANDKILEESWAGFGYNHRGYQEKYFKDTNTGTWYAIVPSGEIYKSTGVFDSHSLVTKLNRDYWEDPYRLFSATRTQTHSAGGFPSQVICGRQSAYH